MNERFHRWFDRHENLSFAFAVLICPIMITTTFCGNGRAAWIRVACTLVWLPLFASRVWYFHAPSGRAL
jgi:hypothetical protein